MACTIPKASVYNGLSNSFTLVLGTVVGSVVAIYDFTAVTRVVLIIDDSAGSTVQTVDSDISSSAFDWSIAPTQGELKLTLGGESIPDGIGYQVKLITYSPAKPLGELQDVSGMYAFTVDVSTP